MRRPIALLALTLLVACSESTLVISSGGGGSMNTVPGQPVTFGSGPIAAEGGAITLVGQGAWDSTDLTKLEGVFLVNPDENLGQEPGIVTDLASKQFRSVHPPDGLVLAPDETWFVVLTVAAKTRGEFQVPDVTLEYGSGRQLTVPMNMTIRAK